MKEEGVSNTYGLTASREATAWAPPCQVGSQPHVAASRTATRVLALGRFQRWVGDRLVAAMVGSQLGLGPRSWDPKGWKSLTRPPGPDKRNLWPRRQRQNPRTTSSGQRCGSVRRALDLEPRPRGETRMWKRPGKWKGTPMEGAGEGEAAGGVSLQPPARMHLGATPPRE